MHCFFNTQLAFDYPLMHYDLLIFTHESKYRMLYQTFVLFICIFLFYLVWSVSIFPFLCLFFPRGCPSFICLSLAERLIVSCLSLSLIFLMQFNCRLFPARGRDRQQKKRKKESKKTVIERDSFFSSAFFISVSCNHFSEVKHTSLLLFLERADCGVIALYVRAVKAS